MSKPIPDHRYHSKSDEQLRYIVKDASEAAQNMRGFDEVAEGKYLDQCCDAETILSWRYRRDASLSARQSAFLATSGREAVYVGVH